ncbi:ABC transporter permease [Thermosipho sp. 1063]|nr:ABC transporter permease [Thermosipho sp. 1063]
MFKIPFRNVIKNWKKSLLVILGSMIATMLVVGALSLNDSVNNWFANKIKNNFGNIDIVAKDKSDTFFFPKTLNITKISKYLDKLKEKEKIKDYTFVNLISTRIQFDEKFIDVFAIGYDKNFFNFSKKIVNGVIISKDLAGTLNVKKGDKINLITLNGKKVVEINEIGAEEFNFRGETGMTNGSIFLPKDLMLNLKIYTYKEPNTVFISLKSPIKNHLKISAEISKLTNLRTTPTKYNLRYSPLNKVIGYLFLGFSGFALLSSFLFVSNFFGVLAEDRKKVFGTLRALGFSKYKIGGLLFLEGAIYIIFSSLIGATLGILFGKYLLSLVNKAPEILSSNTMIPEKITFFITTKTILLGISVSIVVPLLLLIFRSISFSKLPPVVLLSNTEILPKKKYLYFLLFVGLLTILNFNRFYFLIFLILTLPIFIKKNYILVISGISAILLTLLQIGTGVNWDYLIRSIIFLIASIYLVFSILDILKSILKKFHSITSILSISYIEKQKLRNYVVFLVYAIITLVIILTAIIPTSIFKYINQKLNTGILGHNFIIIENPLKSFLSFSNYDEEFKSMFKNISKIQLVNARKNGKHLVVILASENICKSLKIKGKDIPKLKLKDGLGNKNILKNGTNTILLTGILPGISARFNETFNVVDTYDPKELLVPLDAIFVYDKKISGALTGYAGIIKEKFAEKAKKIVYEKFDSPLYITEELNKIFSGIKYFVNIAIQLFYFGFISGFSGLTILSLKNVHERRRIIGALKAIGVNKKIIFKSFLTETFLIVTIAIITAIFTNIFITLDIFKMISSEIPNFKITIPWGQISLVLLGIYLITTIFTIYPANLAQKIKASEAIRVFD